MFKVSIPEISDTEMMSRYERIKPVITVNGKLYSFREYTLEEVKGTSYLWNRKEDMREEVNEDLQVLQGKDFICLHHYGYYGFFKPTVGEVLSQINECDVPFIKAFEIIQAPKTADNIYKDNFSFIALCNGYHVSVVRLYGKKE